MSTVQIRERTAVPVPFPITVDVYEGMVQSGLLTQQDRVELIRGQIIQNMALNPPHAFVNTILMRLLIQLLPLEWTMRVQMPIRLNDSMPEPDIAIVRERGQLYRERHPQPADCAIVIEISDSTLRFDRLTKRELYRAAEIPQYWIVNVPDEQVEVYGEDAAVTIYRTGDTVPVIINNATIGTIEVNHLFSRS